MRVLVTGGAGYIGSHLVRRLAEDKCEVTVYDNLSSGFKENVAYGNLIVGDLNDAALLDRVFMQGHFDVVMHFAASIVVPESVEDPLKYYTNNFANTINLLNVMLSHGVNKIIFSSTAAVYGIPEKPVIDENTPTNPINPYGESKLMVEKLLRDLKKADKIDYIILRYFNAVGAAGDGSIGERKVETTHLVDNCFKSVLNTGYKLNILGTDYNTPDGTCIRDYIHVEDIAEAHVLALHYIMERQKSDIFNCGYGKGYSVLDIVNAVKKITGVDFQVQYAERRAGDPPVLIADSTRIKNILGWKPGYYDLEKIIETAWKWEKIKSQLERSNHGYSQII